MYESQLAQTRMRSGIKQSRNIIIIRGLKKESNSNYLKTKNPNSLSPLLNYQITEKANEKISVPHQKPNRDLLFVSHLFLYLTTKQFHS